MEYNEDEIENMVQDVVETWEEYGLVLEEQDVDMVREVLKGNRVADDLTKCLLKRCKNTCTMRVVKEC